MGHAKATFLERSFAFGEFNYFGIEHGVKFFGLITAAGFAPWNLCHEYAQVKADLVGTQTDSVCNFHCPFHSVNKVVYFLAAEFFEIEFGGFRPQKLFVFFVFYCYDFIFHIFMK